MGYTLYEVHCVLSFQLESSKQLVVFTVGILYILWTQMIAHWILDLFHAKLARIWIAVDSNSDIKVSLIQFFKLLHTTSINLQKEAMHTALTCLYLSLRRPCSVTRTCQHHATFVFVKCEKPDITKEILDHFM